ncbi:DUF748 domain-containing protein [Desulfopila sp. IMCC35008]|uniref:DUF748 domain-containing protein n=1 Tax=Desulfopila sp. IMCC35008 TaxID=2653858 RepID=UPI0013D72C65|nr:DUF748 domain-containing protein [Desulfopila sp. IMCC35008]
MSDHYGTINISQDRNKPSPPPHRKKKGKPGSKRGLSSQPSTSSTLIITAIIFAVVAALYAAVGFILVPKFISKWLPENVRAKTGVELTIQTVEFNPFTFALQFGPSVLVDPKSKKHDLIALDSLKAKLAPLSLLRGDVVTKSLLLEKVHTNVVRYKDSTYNFTPFIKSLKKSEQSDFMDFSELPFFFSLNNIILTNSKLQFEDIPKKSTHVVENIELALPNISNFPYQTSSYIRPKFSAIINGSPLELTSQTDYDGPGDSSETRKTELSCNINKLDLSLYFSYLPTPYPFSIKQGYADGELKLTFSPGSKENKLLTELNLQITDLKIAEKNSLYTIEVPSTKLEGAIQPVTGDTYMKQVVLREPVFHIRKGNLPELLNLLTPTGAGQEAQPSAIPATPPVMAIDLLLIDNGSYTSFVKNQKESVDSWESIQFNLKSFTSDKEITDKSKPTFRISAEKANSHAIFNWQGEILGNNIPSGSFRIDDIETKLLFEWLEIPSLLNSTGTADITGSLTYQKKTDKTHPVDIKIKKGNLILHDLSLKNDNNKEVWYSAPITKISGLSKSGLEVNLGNIFLKNSSVSLSTGHLPPLFSEFSKNKTNTTFQALEFKGELELRNSANKHTKPLKFNSVNLQAVNLDKNAETGDQDNLTFKAQTDNGEVQAKGKLTLEPFSTVLQTAFKDISAQKLLPWFGKSAFLTETTGLMHGKGTFLFPEVSFSGQLSISNGELGRKNTSALKWKSIDFKDIRINQTPFYLGGSEIAFVSPLFLFEREATSTHPAGALVTYLNQQLPKMKGKPQKSVNLSSIELQKISVSDGTIKYKENRVEPPWSADITYFRGLLNGINRKNGSGASSPFSFSGNIDTIPFTLDGTINLFDLTAQGNSLFNMKGYPFPSFHEQLTGQTDIDTSQGELSVTTRSDWNNGIVNEQNQLLFTRVQPDSISSDTAFTIALLTDAERRFELLVTKKHKITEGSEPLLDATLTTFGKFMVKAAVSPFLIASGDYADMADNEYAEFLPGQIALSGHGRESLTRYSSLLSTHPQIGIIVTGGADKKIDTAALQEQLEQAEMERVGIENDKRRKKYEAARQEYFQKLQQAEQANGSTSQIVEQNLPAELLQPFTPIEPEPVLIDHKMLQNLAQQRARVIVDFFTDKLALEPERITISERPRITDSDTSGANKVFFRLQAFTGKQKNGTADSQPQG